MASRNSDLDNLVLLAGFGLAAYVLYQVVSAAHAVGAAVGGAVDAGNNLDANLGLTSFDQAVQSLFEPPGS
jgi:hypothetical protein